MISIIVTSIWTFFFGFAGPGACLARPVGQVSGQSGVPPENQRLAKHCGAFARARSCGSLPGTWCVVSHHMKSIVLSPTLWAGQLEHTKIQKLEGFVEISDTSSGLSNQWIILVFEVNRTDRQFFV